MNIIPIELLVFIQTKENKKRNNKIRENPNKEKSY